MRIFKKFVIALTPLILNAELVEFPEIEEPAVILKAEPPQPIPIPETPLILNVEMPVAKQDAVIEEVKAESAQESSILTNTQETHRVPAEEIHPKPMQESTIVTNPEEPKSATLEQTPVAAKAEESQIAPLQESTINASSEEIKSTSQEKTSASANDQPVLISSKCNSPLHEMRVDLRHTEAKGVGYHDGYTTLEGFGIYGIDSHFMPFVDIRGHIFNDGKLAGNIGLGQRTYVPSINHFFGFYLYYDVRQGNHHLTVNQLTPGFEILGHRMEYRINGYFPIGKKESRSYDVQFDHFKGNRMVIKKRKRFAMTGVDGEIGAHLTQSTKNDVYAGLGPYYFTAAPFSSWGGKARVLWRYREYISLEATYSYDSLFKDIFQGTISFTYPFGPKLKRSGENCPNQNDLVLARAAFAPYRFEIPVVKRKTYREHARNSATGLPLQVWFVNNTSNSLGTYESPFPTLAQAQNVSGPNDLIYVFAGDGTTKGLNQGIVLQNGQTLYGSGISHPYKTQQGKVLIPAFSSTSPKLTSAGSIIQLANGNEVSGLNLFVTQAGTNAIDGNSGITGVNINHNTISGNVSHTSVAIVGSGLCVVENNICSDLTSGPSFEAIRLQVSPGNSMIGIVNNNQIQNFQFGIGTNITLGSFGYFNITNNNLTASTIYFGGSHGKGVAFIDNNTVNDSSQQPAIFLQNLGQACLSAQVQNNFVNNTQNQDGIFIQANSPSAKMNVTLKNNQLLRISAGKLGVNTSTQPTSTLCLEISNNVSNTGYEINNSGGGTIYLAPFVNNIGPLIQEGVITQALPGSCSCD